MRGAVEHLYRLVGDAEAAQMSDPLTRLLALCGWLTIPSRDGGYPQPVELDDQARVELQRLLDQLKPRVESVVRSGVRRRRCL